MFTIPARNQARPSILSRLVQTTQAGETARRAEQQSEEQYQIDLDEKLYAFTTPVRD